WGDNSKGQLGDGTTTGRLVPTRIVPAGYPGNFDKLWVAIAAGGSHSLALHADGTLWAWGSNDSGQAGGPVFGSNTTKPCQVAKTSNLLTNVWNSNWVAIAAGLNHSLALQADGTLWAWGNNYSGQLGNGDQALHPAAKNVPVMVATSIPYVSIAAGDNFSAARRADGTLWLWGNNTFGKLGIGTSDPDQMHPVSHSTPVQELSHASDWNAAGVGSRHIVAPKASGSLWAWGDNSKGELGYGTAPDSVKSSPAPLAEGEIDVVSAVDFNAVAIGTVPTKTIYIRNTGSGPLTVNSIALGGTDGTMFGVTAGTCGISLTNFTVKTGGSCTIVASFNPSTVGIKNATLTITSSDPLSSPVTVALTGTAVVPVIVTTSVSPAGSGIISPNGTNGTVFVLPGSGQQFYILPNTGYHLLDVKVDGVSKGAATAVNLPVITSGATIMATFIKYYAITMNAGANGVISGPATPNHGDSPIYTITPNTGYHVVDVKVDGVSKGAATVVTLPAVTSGATIVATFAINNYTITRNITNGVISGPATANHGDSPSYTIVPDNGYHVLDVKVDGVSKGAVTSLTIPAISANTTITALLGVNNYTIAASADARGSIAPSGNITVVPGANQTFTFTPITGYNVVNVVVDGVPMGSLPSYTFTNV